MNNNESIYKVSNETALSVQNKDNEKLAVNSGFTPPPYKAPETKKPEPEKKAKKKVPVGTIIMIAVIVLLAAAVVFFGYMYFKDKVSKEIMADLTGTWIYDTGSENAGYVSFMGNETADVNGKTYTVTADKSKLVFKKGEDDKFGVEYSRDGEQLMLALNVGNELFGEDCAVTASPSDLSGILLYRISDSHSLTSEEISAAYLDRFPQYIKMDLNDLWEGLWGGEIADWGDISGYLPELDSPEDLLELYDQFSNGSINYEDYLEGILGGDGGIDPSQYIQDYFAGLGEDIATEIDGTEAEEFLADMYEWWQYFEKMEEGDYEGMTDSFDWGFGDYSEGADSFDWGFGW